MARQYPFAVINTYANDGVVSRHRNLQTAVQTCKKLRKSLYSQLGSQNALAPWTYAIWDEEKGRYRQLEPDTEVYAQMQDLENPDRRFDRDDY